MTFSLNHFCSNGSIYISNDNLCRILYIGTPPPVLLSSAAFSSEFCELLIYRGTTTLWEKIPSKKMFCNHSIRLEQSQSLKYQMVRQILKEKGSPNKYYYESLQICFMLKVNFEPTCSICMYCYYCKIAFFLLKGLLTM